MRQAEQQRKAADSTVTARIPEAFQWALAPEQASPAAPVTWDAAKLSSGEGLAVRASKKLRSDELLIPTLGATVLRKYMDDIPLWRDDSVPIRSSFRTLPPSFTCRGSPVPTCCFRPSARASRRSRGILTRSRMPRAGTRRVGGTAGFGVGRSPAFREMGLGCWSGRRWRAEQLDAEVVAPNSPRPGSDPSPGATPGAGPDQEADDEPANVAPRRYHGTVLLDPARVGRDASRIAEEVIAHLAGLVRSKVRVTLEIEAEVPEGSGARGADGDGEWEDVEV